MKKLFLILVMLVAMNASGQWQADVRLTNDNFESSTSSKCIAIDGNIVHVVWVDTRDGNPEIYYKRSSNGGLNWENDVRISNNVDSSRTPAIVSSSSYYVDIVWADKRDGNWEIYYRQSQGSSWFSEKRLTNDTSESANPSISKAGSILYVVWSDKRHGRGEIYSKRMNNNVWDNEVRLTNDSAISDFPCIASSTNSACVVWQDNRDGNREIYFKKYTSGGGWSTDFRLTNDANVSSNSFICLNDNKVYVAWQDNRDGNNEIYYKHSPDLGLNWGPDTRQTNNLFSSRFPAIAVSGLLVHIFWQDNRDGNNEIYYKRSEDAGNNWSSDIRITSSRGASTRPSVCVFGSGAHLVWTDNRNNTNEIYYKRNPKGADTSSLRYFPIAVGNKWVYSYFQKYPPVSGRFTTKVTKDTMISGKKYYFIENFPTHLSKDIWVSLDSLSNILAKEQYSIFVLINTIPLAVHAGEYSCTKVMDTTLFNKETTSKYFYITTYSGHQFENEHVTFSKNLGINYYHWSISGAFGSSSYECNLRGCVINGIVYGDTILTGTIPIANEMPSSYSLSQNYPNPFNPTTKIKFDIVRVGDVKIIVYDIMGREVQTLVNESLKPGTYEATFDGSKLNSGVYFYKLVTDGFTETKKMLLIK